jgi:hypothetical protein
MEYMTSSEAAPAITVTTTDYHTTGEPFRIVTGGMPDIPGKTVLERREYAINNDEIDRFRQFLVSEPRAMLTCTAASSCPRTTPEPSSECCLAQGRLLDGMWARDDRARRVGCEHRPRGSGRGR